MNYFDTVEVGPKSSITVTFDKPALEILISFSNNARISFDNDKKFFTANGDNCVHFKLPSSVKKLIFTNVNDNSIFLSILVEKWGY